MQGTSLVLNEDVFKWTERGTKDRFRVYTIAQGHSRKGPCGHKSEPISVVGRKAGNWPGSEAALTTLSSPALPQTIQLQDLNLISSTDSTCYSAARVLEIKKEWGDFPGGPVVKESTCQWRGHRFYPWSRKTPHATEQRSLIATPAEPVRLKPMPCNKRNRDEEPVSYH